MQSDLLMRVAIGRTVVCDGNRQFNDHDCHLTLIITQPKVAWKSVTNTHNKDFSYRDDQTIQ